jgi:hypothetical protein
MKTARRLLAVALLLFATAGCAAAQSDEPSSAGTEPPKLLLLVYRQIRFDKEGERIKLETAMRRACDRVSVPNSWIDLESVTGLTEALSFDPFESFEQMEKAGAFWGQIFAGHSEIARLQEEIKAVVASERTVIAVRRDDLGYRVGSINLAQARAMRVLEVRLNPGHENDFVEAFRALSAAYEKMNSDTPWVVYQVNAGMASPAFLVFVPMTAIRQNDDLLARRTALQEAEGEQGSRRMQEIALEAYASTESNIYVVSPEMSHVSKEFAAENPEFWLQGAGSENAKPTANKPATKDDPKPKPR